jgi:hypothetical protein
MKGVSQNKMLGEQPATLRVERWAQLGRYWRRCNGGRRRTEQTGSGRRTAGPDLNGRAAKRMLAAERGGGGG